MCKKDNAISWAAGLFDGEGCIYIHKGVLTKGSINPSYSLRAAVGMTHIPTVKRLYELFGGALQYCKDKENNKAQLRWTLSSRNAILFLRLILPFSITKKEEIKLALKFGELPSAKKWKETPKWLLDKREKMFLKIKALKRKTFKYIHKVNKKIEKQKQFTKCPICDNEMHKYNSNGIIKKYCSKKCSKRKLNESTEAKIIRLKNAGTKSKDILRLFSLKKGTLQDILKRGLLKRG